MLSVSNAADFQEGASIGGGIFADDRAFAIVSAATPGEGWNPCAFPIVCPLASGQAALVGIAEGRGTGEGAPLDLLLKRVVTIAAGAARLLPAEIASSESSFTAMETLREASLKAFPSASATSGHFPRTPSLALAGLVGDRFAFAVRGDCRAYILRDGVLRSPIRHGDRDGAGEPGAFPARSIPGGCFAAPGDVLLLCSARLLQALPEARIAHLLATSNTPTAALRRLLEEARRGGGDGVAAALVSYGPWVGALAPATAPVEPVSRGTARVGWRFPMTAGVLAALTATLLPVTVRALWPSPADPVESVSVSMTTASPPVSKAKTRPGSATARPAPAKKSAPSRPRGKAAPAVPASPARTVKAQKPSASAAASAPLRTRVRRKRSAAVRRVVRPAATPRKVVRTRSVPRIRRASVARRLSKTPPRPMGGIPAIRR